MGYRWALVFYFIIWLVVAGKQGGHKYFIYLTNWAHLAYNSYLVVSAVSTSLKLALTHSRRAALTADEEESRHLFQASVISEPDGYWNRSGNTLSWYQVLHWVLFTVGNEIAVGVMLLYWTLDYRGQTVDGVNANTHLLNGILAVVDVWLSGVPVYLLHCLYLMSFYLVYGIFSGLYFIGTGENIYPILDYRGSTGSAVGLSLAVTFLVTPLFHFCVYVMYLCRQWLVYQVCALKQVGGGGSRGGVSTVEQGSSVELTEIKNLSNDSDA